MDDRWCLAICPCKAGLYYGDTSLLSTSNVYAGTPSSPWLEVLPMAQLRTGAAVSQALLGHSPIRPLCILRLTLAPAMDEEIRCHCRIFKRVRMVYGNLPGPAVL